MNVNVSRTAADRCSRKTTASRRRRLRRSAPLVLSAAAAVAATAIARRQAHAANTVDYFAKNNSLTSGTNYNVGGGAGANPNINYDVAFNNSYPSSATLNAVASSSLTGGASRENDHHRGRGSTAPSLDRTPKRPITPPGLDPPNDFSRAPAALHTAASDTATGL
jgi:hypothetical protein